MKRYIIGYIRVDDTPAVRLQEIDEEGQEVGEPTDAPAWQIDGVLVTDERGRVLLEEKEEPAAQTGKSSKNSKNTNE